MQIHVGPWDLVLIVAVSTLATVVAYLHRPRWKALMINLPIPFTVMTLALGRSVDATNALGLILLLLFTHGVRLLHYRLGLPIVPAIVISALGYIGVGGGLAQIVPPSPISFWIAAGATFGFALGLHVIMPHPREPGHRTPLPVWIKLPIVAAVVTFVVVIKGVLGGFATVFPMVGVVGAYEARHSLWTACRQMPVVAFTIIPLMAVCRVAQGKMGLGGGLAVGWIVFLAILIPVTIHMWRQAERQHAAARSAADG